MVGIYIYAGRLWCGDCTEEIKKNLDDDGKTPKNVDDVFSYESTDYPKGPYDDEIKSDAPRHCSACGAFLENKLSASGKAFVAEMIAAIKASASPPTDDELDIMNFYGKEDTSDASGVG